MVRGLLFARLVQGLLLLLLAAPQEAEALDLIDLLDEVDLVTRAEVEDAIARSADLSDLPLLVGDLALPPRTRDRGLGLTIAFTRRWRRDRSVLKIWAGLSFALDLWIFPPVPAGPPPEERERTARCAELASSPPRLRAARFEALGCGVFR